VSLSNAAAITGVGETAYTKASGRAESSLALEAIGKALLDAGIDSSDIDGLIPFPGAVPVDDVIANLRLEDVRFTATVEMGGASMVAALQVAATAIVAGEAECIVIYIARNGSSGRRIEGRVQRLPGQLFKEQLERPYGWVTPAQWYSVICRRHMHEFGTTKEHLARVALTMRSHAQLNPNAQMFGRALTREQYFDARMVADPYQLFDCCMETDGAAAIVVVSDDRGRRHGAGVRLRAVASARPASPDDITNRANWFDIGLSAAAPRAYAMAGAGPSDVDVAMIYDCFTFELIHQLEEAGFCARGSGGPFVASGAIGLGGELPVNPHGGLLSAGHMAALNHVVEAVRQLRGQCGARQVAGARLAAVTGWGNLGDGAMAILEKP
jgi:acetyl-CoA acetyltransferase